MRRSFILVLAVTALLAAPARLAAQNQDVPLSQLLPELYVNQIDAEFNAFLSVFDELVDVEELERSRRERLAIVYQIIDLAGNQLSSFPVGSASGGFVWQYDPTSATYIRASNSFGPLFAERPLTIGRKRLTIGANYQRVTFDHLEDRSLRGGEIVGYFGQTNLIGPIGFFFADSLDVKVTTDTWNAFATYGLTDRLDIGVAVPINRVAIDATLTSRVGSTLTGVSDTIDPIVTSRSGKAAGIGDVTIRAKYNILNHDAIGIAEAIDVRLPTGDEADLLGIAGPQVKLAFIAATEAGRLSPHVNLAYTISGTSEGAVSAPGSVLVGPPEEISYAAGADYALSLRTTVAFDAVGRVLRKEGKLMWGPTEFGPEFQQFHFEQGDLHLLLGSAGLKINPYRNLLFTANVLFPLTKSGLTDELTWMAGFDYSF
jgi:hypothetical protein